MQMAHHGFAMRDVLFDCRSSMDVLGEHAVQDREEEWSLRRDVEPPTNSGASDVQSFASHVIRLIVHNPTSLWHHLAGRAIPVAIK